MSEDVVGLQDLLGEMGDCLTLVESKHLIAKALRDGAQPVIDRMSQLAPDDPETPGSRLKNIGVSVTEQQATGAIAKIGVVQNASERASQAAWAAEVGSAYQSATPFVRPAFDEKQGEALEIIGDTLSAGIEKALK